MLKSSRPSLFSRPTSYSNVISQSRVSSLSYCGKIRRIACPSPATSVPPDVIPGTRFALIRSQSPRRTASASRGKISSGSKFGTIPKNVTSRRSRSADPRSTVSQASRRPILRLPRTSGKSSTCAKSHTIDSIALDGISFNAADRAVSTSGRLTSQGTYAS